MLLSSKVQSACTLPRLIIEAPIHALIVTAKSLAFLRRIDIPVSSNNWPLVVVNAIQVLARKSTLVFGMSPVGSNQLVWSSFRWGFGG